MNLARTSGLLSKSVSYALVAALVCAAIAPLHASSDALEIGQQPAGRSAAENTQIVVNGGIVHVNYDLVGPAAQTYEVSLDVSQNGGRTYEFKAKALTGDVGSGIRPGVGKTIVWEAAKDTDSLQFTEYRFRVAVKPEGPAPAQQATPTPPTRPQPPPTRPAKTPSGRNPYLWTSLGLIGGGAAISILAAKGPMRTEACDEFDCFLVVNKPAAWGGVATAGIGGFLYFLGHREVSRMPSVGFIPKGMVVTNTLRF